MKPIPKLSEPEVADLQRSVDALAAQETTEQELDGWLQDWAADEGKTVDELWTDRGLTGSPQDRERARGWKSDWDATVAAKAASETATPDAGHQVAPVVDAPPSQPQPAAPNVEDKKAKGQHGKQGPKPAVPTKPHKLQDVGRLGASEMHDRELIAVVRKEHANGGAYVDFQLAADDPAAAGRTGLFLHANPRVVTDKQGRARKLTNTWEQLSRSEYADLRLAAGDNYTEVNGKQVYAVRGDIEPWGQGGKGYQTAAGSFSASKRRGLDQDVLAKQHESESRARMTALEKKVDQRASLIEGSDQALTPQQRAFERAQQRQQRSRDRGPEL